MERGSSEVGDVPNEGPGKSGRVRQSRVGRTTFSDQLFARTDPALFGDGIIRRHGSTPPGPRYYRGDPESQGSGKSLSRSNCRRAPARTEPSGVARFQAQETDSLYFNRSS